MTFDIASICIHFYFVFFALLLRLTATLYCFQLVVRYFGLTGAFIAAVYASLDSGAAGGHLCNKAPKQVIARCSI